MRLDRLDKAVFITVAVTLILLSIILLRGDQVGVQIVRSSPANDASNVPMGGRFSLTFGEPLITTTLEGRLTLTPAMTGTWHWTGNTAFFMPSRPLQPDTAYQLTVLAGASSVRGRSVLQDYVVHFRTSPLRMAFLSPITGVSDLYVQGLTGAEQNQPPQRLTSEPFGVRDYAISPDGTRIVYSAKRAEDGELDLWLVNVDGSDRKPLLTCNRQWCQTPSWSTDGTRIAFQIQTLVSSAAGTTPGAPRIYVVDVESREAVSLLDDQQRLGFLPRFAPVNNQLSFYDSSRTTIVIFDTATLKETQLPNDSGDSGAWSPDGNQLVYSQLVPVADGLYSQLQRFDLARSVSTSVTALSTTNDAGAVWAPQGDRIAFGRQVPQDGSAGPGAKIWVMNADGSDARVLASGAGLNYSALSWSADGHWIATLLWDLSQQNSVGEIWLIDSHTGNRFRLARDAWQPAWFP